MDSLPEDIESYIKNIAETMDNIEGVYGFGLEITDDLCKQARILCDKYNIVYIKGVEDVEWQEGSDEIAEIHSLSDGHDIEVVYNRFTGKEIRRTVLT